MTSMNWDNRRSMKPLMLSPPPGGTTLPPSPRSPPAAGSPAPPLSFLNGPARRSLRGAPGQELLREVVVLRFVEVEGDFGIRGADHGDAEAEFVGDVFGGLVQGAAVQQEDVD